MSIVTKELKHNNKLIKVHGFVTGKLAIKKSAMTSQNPGSWSTLLSFKDKEFGEWLPVWSWAIEHPEGVFLIDTGVTSDLNRKDYFRKLDFISKYYFEKQMVFDINREDEIDKQLKKVGLTTNSITTILLTHLHIDHTSGLKHFQNTPVLVNEKEWKFKDGSFPALFPGQFEPEKKILHERFENFENCCYITKDQSLLMVETDGHTRGHSSVVLKTDDGIIFFAGDLAYTQERMIDNTFSATIKNYKTSVDSCQKVKDLSKHKPIIFLPSHDGNNAERLTKMQHIKHFGGVI